MYRIGIDLGGTNIAVGVVNDRYEIVARRSVPTGAERPAEEVIRDMGDAVEEALRQAGLTAADCASMGVGSPGACDPQTGVVKRAYNLNWFDVPVCRMLHQRFGIPVRLGNDANCAALAEVVAGAAVGCQDMVLITLGTGVGSGIISRGKILSGLRGGAGEAGHMLLVLDGEPCTCGRRGCFEAYCSATALIKRTRQAMEEDQAHYEELTRLLKNKHKQELLASGMEERAADRAAEKRAIEDARFVLPNACTTKMIVTMNARSLQNFFRHRCCNRAQWEIRELAERMRALCVEAAPHLFRHAGPPCLSGPCPEGKMSCGKMREVREKYGVAKER